MKNLKNLLTTPLQLQIIPKWIIIMLVIAVLIGFADATYLTVEHYQNKIPPCTIGGCEIVLTGSYSQIIGIPVSLLGAIYYLFILIFLILYIDLKKEIFLRVPLIVSIFGLIASIWFSYLQIFVIKAFCPYCAVSAVTSLIIFISAFHIFSKNHAIQRL